MGTGALIALNKFTGFEELMPGMTLNDFHAAVYLSTGNEICTTVKGGEKVSVPTLLSSMSNVDYGKQLRLSFQLKHTNSIGETSLGYDGFKADRLPTLSAKRA
jgi:hypothetical protein